MSKADRWWVALTLGFLGVFTWRETDAYARHDPAATMTYWWRRVLGISPRHWRRFALVPIAWLFCLWFPIHISWNVIGIPVKR